MRSLSSLPGWAFALIVIGSITVGASALHAVRDTPPPPKPKKQHVATTALTKQNTYLITRQFAGTVEPTQSATLAFERAGTIATMLIEEGQSVSKGQVLAELDNRRIKSQLKSLDASLARVAADLELAKRVETRQRSLQNNSFNSQNDYDQAKSRVSMLSAQLREIESQADALKIDLERTQLIAPFDGKIVSRTNHAGSHQPAYQPVITMVQDDAMRVRTGVPAKLKDSVSPNTEVTISTAQGQYAGIVDFRGPTIDPRTRTLSVLVTPKQPASLIYGDVVSVSFSVSHDAEGYWVPSSALVSGTRGTWLVRALKDGSELADNVLVSVLSLNNQRAYISGPLGNYNAVISGGNHKLAPNQPIIKHEAK